MNVPRTATAQYLITRYSSLIERRISSSNIKLGRLLHAHLVKTSLNLHTFLANRLVHIYCQNVQLDDGIKVLDEMPHPNFVGYNCVISQLGRRGRHAEAMDVFRRMQRWYGIGVAMDNFTAVGVVSACGGLVELGLLRQVHGVMVSIGLRLNEVVYNSMINGYGKCGDFESSRLVFDRMLVKNDLSWTSMLGVYSQNGRSEEASWVFENMPVRNVVSWTMLISGYVQNDHGEKALELFRKMVEEETRPNPFTFVSVLSACAKLAIIGPGKQLHCYILRSFQIEDDDSSIFICNALIDTYAKCGDMCSAMVLFEMMPERDTISWNSIITGFAQHGCGKQSFAVFERMERSDVVPNHVTFLGLLSACNHAGLVSKGRYFLDLMENKYGIRPKREHYAVLVDLLGRNSQLKEAVELLQHMPGGSGVTDIRCWGSLLAACRVHEDVDLARRAAEALFKLEPANFGRYAMMSNVYASAGLWEESRMVREFMKDRGLSKEPACSWIEVKNVRHAFVAEDKCHPQNEKIYQMLFKLVDQMKEL